MLRALKTALSFKASYDTSGTWNFGLDLSGQPSGGADTGSIDTLRLGAITARHLRTVTSPAFGDTDVLGMNFLSRLASWRVEGKTLVLVPATPTI